MALAGLVVLALSSCATPDAAQQGDGAKPTVSAAVPAACPGGDRDAGLRKEQARVQKWIDDNNVRQLSKPDDLARLARPNATEHTNYSFATHQYTSTWGMGVGIANVDPVNGLDANAPGRLPDLLFYRPNPAAADVTDPVNPDFPYTFAGWTYITLYTPGKPPSLLDTACIAPADWFVHERSIHRADNWQNFPIPPKEDKHGHAGGLEPAMQPECGTACPDGLQHPRVWVIDIWLDGDDAPTVSMFNPGEPIPGVRYNVGGDKDFFYPDK